MAELARRGYATVAEPGRRIVREAAGGPLPWTDMDGFLRRAVEISRADLQAARHLQGWVFFDRGLVDAVVGLEHLHGAPDLTFRNLSPQYHHQVFLTPPWPEIYVTDPERRHDISQAVAEYDRLTAAYPALGYTVIVLPKVSVSERADFVLATLNPFAADR